MTRIPHQPEEPPSELDVFRRQVNDGLHAMAQPLTVLRSAVAMLSRPQIAEATRLDYLELASAEMERTCRLFADLSGLIAAASSEAVQSQFDLWSLLAPLIDACEAMLREIPAEIRLSAPGLRATILGDAERTEQALSAVTMVMIAAAAPGDLVQVETTCRDGFLRLAFRNERSSHRQVSSADRLKLSVARASVLSQQGTFTFSEHPLLVTVALRLQPVAVEGDSAQDVQLRRALSHTPA